MNKTGETSFLQAAVAVLRDLDLKATIESPRTGNDDGRITIGRDGKTFRYRVEIKRSIRPGLLGSVALLFSGHTDSRLLVTDHVSSSLADELRLRGIQFVDAAGNVYLNRRGLLVFITGRRPRERMTAARPPRVFRPSGLRTTFALLSLPELLAMPQRDIARAARVALGSVSAVLEGLRELGYLATIDGKLRLLQRDRLLQQWTEAYARVLEPTLEIARFSAASPLWWRQTDLTAYHAQWGGETATAILHRWLIPEHAIVYAAETPRALLSQQRLKADPEGRVILRRRFWNFETQRFRPDVVPPLLIYADLVAAGDSRSLAAAEQIRDEYLD